MAVLVLGGLAVVFPRHGPMAVFRVERNVLVVSDAGGRALWRKEFDYPLRGELPGDRLPHSWFGDLYGDGGTEFLFVAEAAAFNTLSTPLVCYSSTGVELWRFLPGRTVRTSEKVFAPPYSVQTFTAGRIGHGRGVVVSSAHSLYYPDQVVLLSTDGKVLREYWHSGVLTQIALADMDGDGKNDIVLGGVNNGLHAATLIVLDPDALLGASVETVPGYQLLGFNAAVERARILFPRSCMNRLLEPYGYVANLRAREGLLTVDVWDRLAPIYSSLHYQFDKRLRLQSVTLSDAFLAQHHQLEAARQLNHRFSPAEEQTLHHLTYLHSVADP